MVLELGLKGTINKTQIDDRLQYNPKTYEFHLVWNDMFELENLIEAIEYVYEKGVENVILHHPMDNSLNESNESYFSEEKDEAKYLDWKWSTLMLAGIVKQYRKEGKNMIALVHIVYGGDRPTHLDYGYSKEEAQENLFKNWLEMKELVGDAICYENGAEKEDDICLRNPVIQKFIVENDIPICLDISHLFIGNDGDNKSLEQTMKAIKEQIVHYHIVDSMGEKHDALVLGKGNIDWKMVKENLNPLATNIFEIGLEDFMDCYPMVISYKYLNEL